MIEQVYEVVTFPYKPDAEGRAVTLDYEAGADTARIRSVGYSRYLSIPVDTFERAGTTITFNHGTRDALVLREGGLA